MCVELHNKNQSGAMRTVHLAPMRGSGDTGASGSGGLEPMELGTASRRTLTRTEYEKLRMEKAHFIFQKLGHLAQNCPTKKNIRPGNGMST